MKENIAQNGIHDYSSPEGYVPPQSPAVQAHLRWFMGLKLGFMMHWSPGSQLGTYESWPLSDDAAQWSQEDFTWADAETCKRQYREANRTFNPVKFSAERLADLAQSCGFKYLLFTTKHHDGFCMYDTATTDYRITSPDCPFHTHPEADVVAALYRAFRARGMGISTYFSKPDWHSEFFWPPQFGASKTRNVNYEIARYPELWKRYVDFVHSQLRELGTKYGKIDVLWLDGGWVRPDNLGQDIRLGEIVRELRSTAQPHLIVCERTCGGEYENFITPETTVPPEALHVPWETCVPLGDYFSFHYTDHFKTGRELVLLLLDVVSKGGNLALNLTPQPDGLLPAPAVRSMRELGAWLRIFGEGIYGTRIVAPYFEPGLYYTRTDGAAYVFCAMGETPGLPRQISCRFSLPVARAVSLRTGLTVRSRQENGTLTLFTDDLPMGGAFYAEGFRLELLP